MFIDIVLVAVAIVAIVGLAAFVHLRSNTKAGHTGQDALQESGKIYAKPLVAADTPRNSLPPGSQSEIHGATIEAAEGVCKQACSAPQSIIEETAETIIKTACNETQKLLELSKYHQAVLEENSSYQKSKSLTGSPLSLVGNALSEATSLLHVHETKLAMLKLELQNQLTLLKCPTDLL